MVFGPASEKRFSNWLHTTCDKNEEEIVNMGMYIVEIGTHSFRKGVSTYVGSQPGGPAAHSIWLRAGWSLGRVQSRYIFQGDGGDQYVGRAATGLPNNSIEFAQLPPHFGEDIKNILTSSEWENILPDYRAFYPVEFRTVLPKLLASLAYHSNWLQQQLHPNHPLFSTYLWRSGKLRELKHYVHTGHFRCPPTGLTATGIPPHVSLYQEMIEMKTSLTSLRSEIQISMETLPEQVCHTVLSHCQVNGAVPITHQQVQTMIQDVKSTMMAAFAEQAMVIRQSVEPSRDLSTNNNAQADARVWTWNGQLHPVPRGFRFPRYDFNILNDR